MSFLVWLRYLIGDRQAILTLANDRRALWVGFLFVLSAGFAREYDGEDLRAEPWHLIIPLAASLASSLVLFVITYGLTVLKQDLRPTFFSAYASFLTLFWMTAPLAWLYAIPYERFLTAAGAVQANLWTLGLVAVWRVALMIRVVHVLMGYPLWAAVFLVMVFADALAFAVLQFMPLPILNIMGGIRLTESERILAATAHNICALSLCSAPLWLLGALAAAVRSQPCWQEVSAPPERRSSGKWLHRLALASLLIWVPILPLTQSEQRLRRQAEQALKEGRIAEALALMSSHGQSDFPPHWDPPPRVNYGERTPRLVEVLRAMVESPPAPWVKDLYLEKIRLYVSGYHARWEGTLTEIVALLRQLPEGPSFVRTLANELGSEWSEQLVGPPEEKPPVPPPDGSGTRP